MVESLWRNPGGERWQKQTFRISGAGFVAGIGGRELAGKIPLNLTHKMRQFKFLFLRNLSWENLN